MQWHGLPWVAQAGIWAAPGVIKGAERNARFSPSLSTETDSKKMSPAAKEDPSHRAQCAVSLLRSGMRLLPWAV